MVGARGAERSVNDRREFFDIRAHEEHVTRLKFRVLLEEVQESFPQDFHLSFTTMAGVQLQGGVSGQVGDGLGTVVAQRCLQSAQQRGRRGVARVVFVVGNGGAQRLLQFLDVAGQAGK